MKLTDNRHVDPSPHSLPSPIQTLMTVASRADVPRLVTRSSPRGIERVTSLSRSVWEATMTVQFFLIFCDFCDLNSARNLSSSVSTVPAWNIIQLGVGKTFSKPAKRGSFLVLTTTDTSGNNKTQLTGSLSCLVLLLNLVEVNARALQF